MSWAGLSSMAWQLEAARLLPGDYVVTTDGRIVPRKYLVPSDRIIIDQEVEVEQDNNNLR